MAYEILGYHLIGLLCQGFKLLLGPSLQASYYLPSMVKGRPETLLFQSVGAHNDAALIKIQKEYENNEHPSKSGEGIDLVSTTTLRGRLMYSARNPNAI